MLYGLDSTHMQHALTPSRAKLVSKAVKSVSMRVGFSIERNASYMGAVGCESHRGGDFTHAVDAAAAPDTTGRQLSWLAAYKFRVIITLLQSLDTLHIGCLHASHKALGALMAPFAGYDMPIEYDGLDKEHTAVPCKASWP